MFVFVIGKTLLVRLTAFSQIRRFQSNELVNRFNLWFKVRFEEVECLKGAGMRILDVFAPKPTQLVRLAPLDLRFIEPYLEMLADPEGRRLTATTAKFDRPKIEGWLATRASISNRKDWAIVLDGGARTSEFVGEVVLNEFDDVKNQMNLRIALRGADFYSRGFGRQAIALALEYAFDELALAKVTLEVLVANPRAIRCYEAVGFVTGRQFSEKGLRFQRMSINKQQFVSAIGQRALQTFLQPGWVFATDTAKRRAGLCNYSARQISISRYYIDLHSIDDCLQVLAHELGHAKAGNAAGHGKKWLAAARQFGYRNEKLTGLTVAEEHAPWLGVCPAGHQHFRYRKPTGPLSCLKCSSQFSSQHLIAWKKR